MTVKKGKRGYTGELLVHILLDDPLKAKRRFSPKFPLMVSSAVKKQEQAVSAVERQAKFPLLFAHFEIDEADPRRWEKLALALAVQHVPGFQVRHKAGAPVVQSVDLLSRLYRYAETKRIGVNNRCRTDSAICQAATKDSGFKKQFPELARANAHRLQNLLSEACALHRAWADAVASRDDYLERCRRDGVDPADTGYISAELPPWIPDEPSPMALRSEAPPKRKRPEKGGGGT